MEIHKKHLGCFLSHSHYEMEWPTLISEMYNVGKIEDNAKLWGTNYSCGYDRRDTNVV